MCKTVMFSTKLKLLWSQFSTCSMMLFSILISDLLLPVPLLTLSSKPIISCYLSSNRHPIQPLLWGPALIIICANVLDKTEAALESTLVVRCWMLQRYCCSSSAQHYMLQRS